MNRLPLWLLSLLLVSTLTGCTSYTNVNTKQIKEFEKTIKADHKQVDDLEVQFSVPRVEFNYTLDEDVDQAELREIFYKTKELILDPTFQQEVIEDKFFAKYYKKEGKDGRIYPRMSIHFDVGDDGQYDYVFDGSYYQTSDVSNPEVRKQVDGYQHWSFWDYKMQTSVPVPEQGNASE